MTIEIESQPGPSNDSEITHPQYTLNTPRHNPGIVKSIVSPEDIRPYPKAPERKMNVTQRGRKKGRTRILTDTPEKNVVELNKKLKTLKKPKVKLVKKKSIRKKLKFVTIDESSEEDSGNDKINIIHDDDDDNILNEIEEMEKDQTEENYLLRTEINRLTANPYFVKFDYIAMRPIFGSHLNVQTFF